MLLVSAESVAMTLKSTSTAVSEDKDEWSILASWFQRGRVLRKLQGLASRRRNDNDTADDPSR